MPYTPVCAASNAFVLSFTLALREELPRSGIAVNVLCPGGMPTNVDSASAPADWAASSPRCAPSQWAASRSRACCAAAAPASYRDGSTRSSQWGAEAAAGIPAERIEPDVLLGQSVLVVDVEFAAALGLPDVDMGGRVAGADAPRLERARASQSRRWWAGSAGSAHRGPSRLF